MFRCLCIQIISSTFCNIIPNIIKKLEAPNWILPLYLQLNLTPHSLHTPHSTIVQSYTLSLILFPLIQKNIFALKWMFSKSKIYEYTHTIFNRV